MSNADDTVIWSGSIWSIKHQYGFIRFVHTDGTEKRIFFHKDDCSGQFHSLQVGQIVKFKTVFDEERFKIKALIMANPCQVGKHFNLKT